MLGVTGKHYFGLKFITFMYCTVDIPYKVNRSSPTTYNITPNSAVKYFSDFMNYIKYFKTHSSVSAAKKTKEDV